MERSDTLESQPGLAGNDENVSKVFFLLEMLTMVFSSSKVVGSQ